MAAAHELICYHSYGAVTIDAICEKADVRKGSFYYFFTSKSDLAVAAIDAWWEQRRAEIEAIATSDRPPLARLAAYFDSLTGIQLAARAANGHILGCPLFTLGAEICTQDERIRLRVVELLQALRGYVTGMVREAQERGDLDDAVPAETRARMLLAFYNGHFTQARIENNAEAVRAFPREAMEFVGLRRSQGASSLAAGSAL
jgi:TetR/AcrR family transcriptional repressor of nem operon